MKPSPLPLALIEFVAIAIVLIGEGYVEYCFLTVPSQWPVVVGGHLAVIVATAALSWLLHMRGERRPLFFLLLLSIAMFGLTGAGGIAVAALVRIDIKARADSFDEWHASLFPRPKSDPVLDLYENLTLRGIAPDGHHRIVPFVEIFAAGTVGQKQVALARIADFFHPSFAPALRRALRDEEPAVRVQAAITVARLEDTFMKRTQAIEGKLARLPDDPAIIIEAARHCRAYADSGIPDSGNAERLRERALAHYDHCIALKPNDPALQEESITLLLQLHRIEEAAARVDPWIARDGATSAMLTAYAEMLYRLKQLNLLRALTARVVDLTSGGRKVALPQIWRRTADSLVDRAAP